MGLKDMQNRGAVGPPGASGQGLSAAIVDDDAAVLHMIGKLLKAEGFVVSTYADGVEAREGFAREQPDIALVDLVMPGMDGMELVRHIRENWDFPVIMVTGGSDEVDEALGLRLGADDYVHKPFATRLLLERIRACLRRSQRTAPVREPSAEATPVESERIVRGELAIDPSRHEVVWRGQPVTLTVTEFQLLTALARRPGVVKTRDQLMDIAYSDQVYVDDRTIDSHIKRLRKKMRSADPGFSAIETLYGIGYRFSDPAGGAAGQ